MSVTLQLPDDLAIELKARAAAQGLTLEVWLCKLVEGQDAALVSGYGLLAASGPAPSEQEIDANRKEMFRDFADAV